MNVFDNIRNKYHLETVYISLFLILILSNANTFCQITFQKTFGGVNDDVFVDFEKTDDNGLLVLGYTNSFGMGENDIIITKLNSAGDIQWSKLYGNSGDDRGHEIKKTNNGDFIICGQTKSSGAGSDDIYILRVDNNGNLLWSKTYGGSDWDQPRGKAIEMANGDFIIISTTLSFGAGGKKIHFLRISSSGDMLLTKTYGGGPDNDWAHDFIPVNNGDIIIGGRINHTLGGSFGGLIRIDETGNVLWAKSYNTSGFCKFYRLKQSDNGNIIAVGRIDSYGAGDADLYVIMTDQNGELLWAKTYGGNSYELANGVDITSNQKIIFSGYTESFGFGENDIFLIKIDNNGNFIWGKTYGGINDDRIFCGADLLNYDNSAYYINGMTKSFGMGNNDMYLIKTDTAGYSGCNEQDFFPTITSPSITVNPIQIYTGSGGIENNPNTIVNDLVLPYNTLCPNDLPVALFLAVDTILCTNSCTNFIDSSLYNPDSWSWYFEGGTPSYSNIQNPSNICYYTPGQFDVQLIVSNDFGSDSIIFFDYITVHPSPEINLGNDTLICAGDSLILNAGSGFESYLWNTGSSDSIIIVDTAGIFWVEVTNEFGCSTIDSIFVDYYPYAFEELELGNDTSICFGDYIIINAGSGYTYYEWHDGSHDSIFIADTAGVYYVYVENPCGSGSDTIVLDIFPVTDINLGNDTTVCSGEFVFLDAGEGFNSYLWQDGSSNQFYYAGQTGSYWVEVTDPNFCFASDTINLEFIFPDPNLGNDTSICYGDSVTFFASDGFVSYLWQNGTDNIWFTTDTTGVYWCEVIDTMGCVGSDSVFLETVLLPNISLGNDTGICLGDSIFLNILPTDNGFDFIWQDGSNDSVFLVTEQGEYWVQASNECGTDTDSVFVSDILLPFVFLGNDTILALNDEIILDAGNGFESFLWNDNTTAQTLLVSDTGSYWVKVSDGTCFNSDTINIERIKCDLFVPIVFTPNSDNYNDYFYAIASDDITNFELLVFNRWGEKIWETNNLNDKWDGKRNGKPAATGTYFWIVKYKCFGSPKEFIKKGSVTLLR